MTGLACFIVLERDGVPILHSNSDGAADFAVFDELEALDPLARGAEQEDGEGPPLLRFTPEALEVFTDWRTDFEAGLRSGDLFQALESHLAKYRKLARPSSWSFTWRLATVTRLASPRSCRRIHGGRVTVRYDKVDMTSGDRDLLQG